MTDKEERIYIGMINPKGDFCPVPMGECNYLCDCCNGGMTRQEAIEKMAKALCLSVIRSAELCKKNCDKPCIMWKSYEIYAEAALNALLNNEEKNNGTN